MGDHEMLYTVKEVAEMLKVSPEAVTRLIRTGKLKAIKIGGRIGYRVRKSEYEAFLEEYSKVAAA